MRVFYFPITRKIRIFVRLFIYTEKQVQSQAQNENGEKENDKTG